MKIEQVAVNCKGIGSGILSISSWCNTIIHILCQVLKSTATTKVMVILLNLMVITQILQPCMY